MLKDVELDGLMDSQWDGLEMGMCGRVIASSDCNKTESIRLVGDTAAVGLGVGNINAHVYTQASVGRLNQSDSLTNRRKPVVTFSICRATAH